mgnify:CR=1 FL=1
MLRRMFRYFFPRLLPREKLPLPSRRYSSPNINREIPEEEVWKIDLIIGNGLARTQEDAKRLLMRYPGLSLTRLIKTEKRKRRRLGRLARAWRRFKSRCNPS